MTTNSHLIIRRWRDARMTGTVHGAECACGERFTGSSPDRRDESVRRHLATHRPQLGQVFDWIGTRCTVLESTATTVTLLCERSTGVSWTKLQELPLAPSFIPVGEV